MRAACSADAPAWCSTLQVIMVDTVLLLGEMEPGVTGPPPKTPLKAAQPAATAAAMPVPMAAAAGAGTSGGTVPLTSAGVALPLSYPAGAAGTAAMSASSMPGGVMPLTSAGVALPVSYPAGGLGAAGQALGGRRLLDFNSLDDPPKMSSEQWAWLEARHSLPLCFFESDLHTLGPLQSELGNSTADWIVVVGNDPVWSVGANGPAPGFAERLLPLLNSAGVALYIGGRDPLAQHFGPVPAAPLVDVIGVGNGANGARRRTAGRMRTCFLTQLARNRRQHHAGISAARACCVPAGIAAVSVRRWRGVCNTQLRAVSYRQNLRSLDGDFL